MKLIVEKITQQDADTYKTEFYKHLLKHFIMDYEAHIKKRISRKDLRKLLKDYIKELPSNITNKLSMYDFHDWAYDTLLKSISDLIIVGEILTKDYVEDNYNPNFIIPEGVKVIDRECFRDTDIESVYIPTSVVEIKGEAFTNCTNLTEITIPNSVTTIGYYAFSGCWSLSSVTLGNSLTTISDDAFSYCSSLTNVTIPESITTIENCAFRGCKKLISIDIPKSIENIGAGAFDECNKLKLNLDLKDYKNLKLIGNSAFDHTQVTLFVDFKSLISGNTVLDYDVGCKIVSDKTIKSITLNKDTCNPIIPRSLPNLETVVLEEDIDELPYGLFKGCVNLRSITCKSAIKYIHSHAFSGCKKLQEVSIPDVEWIYDYAFSDCKELKELPNWKGLKHIGLFVFADCTNLTTVRLNNGFDYLGKYAFDRCKNLKSLFIPDNTTIETDTFIGCNLEEISLPYNIRKIAQRTLRIPSLKKLIYRGRKEEFLVYIGNPEKYLLENCQIIYEGD